MVADSPCIEVKNYVQRLLESCFINEGPKSRSRQRCLRERETFLQERFYAVAMLPGKLELLERVRNQETAYMNSNHCIE